jgi:hypothetical protein
MARTVITQDSNGVEPSGYGGWMIAVVIGVILLLVVLFFVWQGGVFGGSPQTNVINPAPTVVTPGTPGIPGAPGAPGAPGSSGAPGAPGGSAVTTP